MKKERKEEVKCLQRFDKWDMNKKEAFFYMSSLFWVIGFLVLVIVTLKMAGNGVISQELQKVMLIIEGFAGTLLYVWSGKKMCGYMVPRAFCLYLLISMVMILITGVMVWAAFTWL